MGVRRCCECRNGEHENYDNDVKMTVVRDPDTKKLVKRGYICETHVMMYLEEGFLVTP